MAISADVLCWAVCVCDINKAGRCGKVFIATCTNLFFQLFFGKLEWLDPEGLSSKQKQKQKNFCCRDSDKIAI